MVLIFTMLEKEPARKVTTEEKETEIEERKKKEAEAEEKKKKKVLRV